MTKYQFLKNLQCKYMCIYYIFSVRLRYFIIETNLMVSYWSFNIHFCRTLTFTQNIFSIIWKEFQKRPLRKGNPPPLLYFTILRNKIYENLVWYLGHLFHLHFVILATCPFLIQCFLGSQDVCITLPFLGPNLVKWRDFHCISKRS